VIGPGLATNLIQRLIAGPNNWLEPAVRTGFPAGVGLAVDAVTIEAGIARVNLNQSVQLANDDARVAMSQQIVWTLRQLPEVVGVEILSGGAPLSVPGASNPQTRDAWRDVDPSGLPTTAAGFVATAAGVLRLTPDGDFAVPGPLGIEDLGITQMSVSQDGGQFTIMNDRDEMFQSRSLVGSALEPRTEGSGAQSMEYDGATLWFVDTLGRVFSMAPNGEVFPIQVTGLEDSVRIRGVYPSRDGTRAILVVDKEVGSNLLMARITRPSAVNITSIILQAPIRIESKLTEAIDVAWSSANTIAVIGSESAGASQVYEIDLGRGEVLAQGSPEDPVSVAAAPRLPTLIASADGNVYENSTGLWIIRIAGLSPSYPG
jgi:hypothetical protein